MTDWWTPQPALLVADSRTGGTMLASALDSHPQIGFERGQILHKRSAWLAQGLTPDQCAAIAWSRPGYHAAGFRVVYGGFDRLSDDVLRHYQPRVIWLTRKPLDTVISRLLRRDAQQKRAGEAHYFEGDDLPEFAPVTLDTGEVERMVAKAEDDHRRVGDRLSWLHLPVMELTYDLLVDSYPVVWGAQICQWLNVERRELVPVTRRIHHLDWSHYVSNWQDIVERVAL